MVVPIFIETLGKEGIVFTFSEYSHSKFNNIVKRERGILID